MDNFLKKYLLLGLKYFSYLLITLFILTIFNYFNLIKGLIFNILLFIIPIIYFFIISYKIGKISNNKGYITGLLVGISFCLLFCILSLILGGNLHIKSLIYYLIITIISILGGIIGINKKEINT